MARHSCRKRGERVLDGAGSRRLLVSDTVRLLSVPRDTQISVSGPLRWLWGLGQPCLRSLLSPLMRSAGGAGHLYAPAQTSLVAAAFGDVIGGVGLPVRASAMARAVYLGRLGGPSLPMATATAYRPDTSLPLANLHHLQ